MKTSIAACLLIMVVTSLQLLEENLDKEEEHLRKIGVLWQNAIEKTEEKMRSRLVLLKKDASFGFALSENKLHSINQLLKSYHTTGEVSVLGVFGPSCRKISVSKHSFIPASRCSKKDFSQENIHWHIPKDGKTPSITVWSDIFIGGKKHYLFAETFLDRDWQHRHPFISKAYKNLGLKLKNSLSRRETALKKLDLETKTYLAARISKLWLITSLFISPANLHLLLAFLLTVAFFLVMSMHFNHEKYRVSTIKAFSNLKLFCQSLISHDPTKVVLPKVATAKNEPEQVSAIQQEITNILAPYSKALKDQKTQIENLKIKTHNLEENIKASDAKLHKEPLLASLAQQVEDQGHFIKGEIKKTHSLLEDFEDVLRISMIPQVQKLKDMSADWKAGCQIYSPRKFLRTLSERCGTKEDQLSEGLQSLFDTCQNTINVAINLAVQSRSGSEKTKKITHYLEHWQGITKKDPFQGNFKSSILNESLKLLSEKPSDHAIDTSQMAGKIPPFDYLETPKFVWRSLFFHLFSYFSHRSPDKLTLSLELLEKDGEYHIITKSKDDLSHLSGEAKKHLELAMQIAKAQPFEVTPLTSLSDEQVISIHFKKPPKRLDPPLGRMDQL